MISLLASVRDLAEASDAAAAGADLIDLKEPASGALGGLPITEIGPIVTQLRKRRPQCPVSATIGDFRAEDHAGRLARVTAVAGCGVDYVKVGIEAGGHGLAALRSLQVLQSRFSQARPSQAPWAAGLSQARREAGPSQARPSPDSSARPAAAIVIVLLCDHGVDTVLAEVAAAMGFAGLMVDTADKSGGSLLRRADHTALARVIAVARRYGCLSGLAGSLSRDDVAALRQLAPDFAGFRGAVCDGDRRGRFNPGKLRALRAELRTEPCHSALVAPVSGADSRSCIRARSVLPSSSMP